MREEGRGAGSPARADGDPVAGRCAPGSIRWPVAALVVLLFQGLPLTSGAAAHGGFPPAPDAGASDGPPRPGATAATVAARHDVGPPPGVSGGFGEPTCLNCHTGEPLNAYGGSVRVAGLPETWEPGRSYPLQVVLQAEGTVLAGFQMTARYATGPRAGEPAGTLAPVDGRATVTRGETGQPYLHQTEAGSIPASETGTSWTVEWQAPAEGGAVLFNVAANSANGDQSPLLDLVYADEVQVEAGAGR